MKAAAHTCVEHMIRKLTLCTRSHILKTFPSASWIAGYILGYILSRAWADTINNMTVRVSMTKNGQIL